MSEENIATARRAFEEAWSNGNLDVIDETTTDDFVDHDPLEGERDREAAKAAIASYRAAFPDLEITILDIFAAGDKVVARWSANGTMENEFMGLAPTGDRGEPVEGISIDRFEDGKIAETWGQWNVLKFMQNIGAIPEQEAAAAT